MKRNMVITIIGLCLIILAACSGGQGSSNSEGDYEKTKKMVVDILQTEEGKKALGETLADEKMKQELVIQSDVVKKAINETLVSDKGAEMWATLFKDPKFVEGYAKSMEEEQKKLMKSLMSDAEYQKLMLELLQNPEITEQNLTLLKSQQFRSHLEETIQQTLETPLFQAKIQEILLKAAEEQAKGKQKSGSGQSSESGGSNQGGGGSGGGSSGGSSGGQ
ncbi:spore gernimation protein GerD [Oceanobacillus arenosus]|uniref:Spore gernimation protein GerD n=1 Tax=Oceanobacillus arenosus TaxID=1229153 RepID=A0A3D8Q2W6_9BACI|nr:spore germination lipoprotein GerD [Oceanobacillus arenosus]RDW21909.1 spore gernimation protein GerD [Oceanobacillus arenosus]